MVLFGLSAGGYGVYVNFLEVTKRFPNAKITVINDSGPLFTDAQAFPSCLQLGFTLIYGLPLPSDFYDLSKYMLINFFIPSVIVDASKNSVNDFVSHSI